MNVERPIFQMAVKVKFHIVEWTPAFPSHLIKLTMWFLRSASGWAAPWTCADTCQDLGRCWLPWWEILVPVYVSSSCVFSVTSHSWTANSLLWRSSTVSWGRWGRHRCSQYHKFSWNPKPTLSWLIMLKMKCPVSPPHWLVGIALVFPSHRLLHYEQIPLPHASAHVYPAHIVLRVLVQICGSLVSMQQETRRSSSADVWQRCFLPGCCLPHSATPGDGGLIQFCFGEIFIGSAFIAVCLPSEA